MLRNFGNWLLKWLPSGLLPLPLLEQLITTRLQNDDNNIRQWIIQERAERSVEWARMQDNHRDEWRAAAKAINRSLLANSDDLQYRLLRAWETASGDDLRKTRQSSAKNEKMLTYIRDEINNLWMFFLLREIHPDLLRRINILPEMKEEWRADIHNNFSFFHPGTLRIRARFAEEVHRLANRAFNGLAPDNYIEVLEENVEQARGTPYESKAYADLVGSMFHENYIFCSPESILPYLQAFEMLPHAFESHKRMELIRCSLLLEQGEMREAEASLKRHYDRVGTEDIESFFRVADFAREQGFKGEALDEAADCWEHLSPHHGRNLTWLTDYLGDRSLAVVGNGPQEQGLGRGREIDNHDVVARFNSCKLTPEFRSDYGSKMSIWCVNPTFYTFPDGADPVQTDVLFFPKPLDRTRLNKTGRTRMLDHIKTGMTVLHLDKEVLGKSWEVLDERAGHPAIRLPTTGFMFLLAAKAVRPSFSKDDVYGFSFKGNDDSGKAKFTHYHRSRKPIEDDRKSVHNLPAEVETLRQVFA